MSWKTTLIMANFPHINISPHRRKNKMSFFSLAVKKKGRKSFSTRPSLAISFDKNSFKSNFSWNKLYLSTFLKQLTVCILLREAFIQKYFTKIIKAKKPQKHNAWYYHTFILDTFIALNVSLRNNIFAYFCRSHYLRNAFLLATSQCCY